MKKKLNMNEKHNQLMKREVELKKEQRKIIKLKSELRMQQDDPREARQTEMVEERKSLVEREAALDFNLSVLARRKAELKQQEERKVNPSVNRKLIFQEFDSDAFHAKLIYKPIPKYGHSREIEMAIASLDFEALVRYCPDLNYSLCDAQSIAEHFLCNRRPPHNDGCNEFILEHPEISLLPVFFRSASMEFFRRSPIVLDKIIEERMIKELREYVGPNQILNTWDQGSYRPILSFILRKWDTLNAFVQRRLGLIRLGVSKGYDTPNLSQLIPEWITDIEELQLGHLHHY